MTDKYLFYNKVNLLTFDIEKELDNADPSKTHTIKKLFYFFNKSSIEGKFAKPFLIKFIQSDDAPGTDTKWTLETIYQHLQKIPKFQLAANVLADYNCIDSTNKVFPIKKKELIEPLIPFEDAAYEFEVNFGSVLVDDNVIQQLESILVQHEIQFDYDEAVDDHETSISLYTNDAKYHLKISLDGKTSKNNKYEVSPSIRTFNNGKTISIGKFTMFDSKPTIIPNDDNFALVTKCNKCNKNVICNWWSHKGTKCPYCSTVIKVY